MRRATPAEAIGYLYDTPAEALRELCLEVRDLDNGSFGEQQISSAAATVATIARILSLDVRPGEIEDYLRALLEEVRDQVGFE